MNTSVTTEIKNKLDVVEVLGSYIKLEKAGSNFKARCPFHNEKTPSFFVSPKRNSYYCFGCGAKGDIFSFVEQFEGLDFMGALKVLANRAGVTLRFNPKAKEEGDKRDRLFQLMDKATEYFEENLRANKSAIDYLKARGLSEDTITAWRLGFAKDEWHSAEEMLNKEGWKREEMIECGIVKVGEGAKVYDVFRSRIMFPIFDGASRVVAFSGRIFGKDESDSAKYLNSPETELFQKSEILYGYHRAKLGIRRLGFSILVEGQMDLLMSHQAGFDNTVATSGTALTPGHIELLKRLSPNIVIAYDNDQAGFRASLKAFMLGLSNGLNIKVAKISDGKDPADLIKVDKDAWKSAIINAKHIVSVAFDSLIEQKLPKDKLINRFRETIIPLLASIQSRGERSRLIGEHKMALATGVREEYLMDEIENWKPRAGDLTFSDPVAPLDSSSPPRQKGDPGRRLFAILFALEGGYVTGIEIDAFKSKIQSIAGERFDELYAEYGKEKSSLIFEAESVYGDSVEKKELDELTINFEEDALRELLETKMKALQTAEANKDDKGTLQLLMECQKITVRLSKIKAELEEMNKEPDF